MKIRRYILIDRKPVPEPDLLKWASWYGVTDRVVAKSWISDKIEVSTVFLGLDHRWGSGPPILWETMVFGGPKAGECNRCSGSWEQAEAMHEATVNQLAAKYGRTKIRPRVHRKS